LGRIVLTKIYCVTFSAPSKSQALLVELGWMAS
jgi:hypothetical protein